MGCVLTLLSNNIEAPCRDSNRTFSAEYVCFRGNCLLFVDLCGAKFGTINTIDDMMIMEQRELLRIIQKGFLSFLWATTNWWIDMLIGSQRPIRTNFSPNPHT